MNTPQVSKQLTRCPACGSTKRHRYDKTHTEPIDHTDAQGNVCTHVTWQWTNCKACGQRRVDVSHENRSGQPDGEGAAPGDEQAIIPELDSK